MELFVNKVEDLNTFCFGYSNKGRYTFIVKLGRLNRPPKFPNRIEFIKDSIILFSKEHAVGKIFISEIVDSNYGEENAFEALRELNSV